MGQITAGHGAPSHPDFNASLLASQRHLAMESIRETGGLLPQNHFWDYLRWRHDLSPRRFDHYHPIVGHWIERDEALRQSQAPATLPLISPPSSEASRSLPPSGLPSPTPRAPSDWTGQGIGLVPPPEITPAFAAPEPPSALVTALALALAPLFIKRGRRRRTL